MKKWTALGRAVAVGAIVLCSAAARGEPADICAVPSYLLFGDSLLNRVNAAVKKDGTLRIVALGGVSSTLPGRTGLVSPILHGWKPRFRAGCQGSKSSSRR